MAIDGPGIIDSDLAHDIRNEFFSDYDSGLPLNEIRRKVDLWKSHLKDALQREIFISVFCQVLWDVGELEGSDLSRLRAVYQDESGLTLWKHLGAELYPRRKAVLKRQLAKISKPNLRIRRRIAAPLRLFEVGDVLEIQTSREPLSHLLVIDASQRGKVLLYAMAPIQLENDKLDSKSILNAKFVGHKVISLTQTTGFLLGFAVAMLDHRIATKFQDRFRKALNLPIDFNKACVGSFGGITSFASFENEIYKIKNDRESLKRELFRLARWPGIKRGGSVRLRCNHHETVLGLFSELLGLGSRFGNLMALRIPRFLP